MFSVGLTVVSMSTEKGSHAVNFEKLKQYYICRRNPIQCKEKMQSLQTPDKIKHRAVSLRGDSANHHHDALVIFRSVCFISNVMFYKCLFSSSLSDDRSDRTKSLSSSSLSCSFIITLMFLPYMLCVILLNLIISFFFFCVSVSSSFLFRHV